MNAHSRIDGDSNELAQPPPLEVEPNAENKKPRLMWTAQHVQSLFTIVGDNGRPTGKSFRNWEEYHKCWKAKRFVYQARNEPRPDHYPDPELR